MEKDKKSFLSFFLESPMKTGDENAQKLQTKTLAARARAGLKESTLFSLHLTSTVMLQHVRTSSPPLT